MKKPKLIYLGSPEFAVAPLRALAESGSYEIAGVITQPDKVRGRGNTIVPTPVKSEAERLNLKVFQPKSIKQLELSATDPRVVSGPPELEELVQFLNEHGDVDAAIIVAYGKIIPTALFELPRCGGINIHPSLLPRWRGAAPIQHTIFEGDTETAVCLMAIDAGLDTGPVFSRETLKLPEGIDCGTLQARLSGIGTEMLLRDLPAILAGKLTATPQANSGDTYAEKWEVEDATIGWDDSAEVTLRRILASSPDPGARCSFGGETVKIFAARLAQNQNYKELSPGSVVECNPGELIVQSGKNSYLSILELQFPGKKRLQIQDLLRGKKLSIGDRFG